MISPAGYGLKQVLLTYALCFAAARADMTLPGARHRQADGGAATSQLDQRRGININILKVALKKGICDPKSGTYPCHPDANCKVVGLGGFLCR